MLDCLMQPKRAGLVAVFDIMLCIPLPSTPEQEVSLPVTFYLCKVSLGWEGQDYHWQGDPASWWGAFLRKHDCKGAPGSKASWEKKYNSSGVSFSPFPCRQWTLRFSLLAWRGEGRGGNETRLFLRAEIWSQLLRGRFPANWLLIAHIYLLRICIVGRRGSLLWSR